MNGLIYCVMPRATVGFIVEDDVIVECAPYARWALGANAKQVWHRLSELYGYQLTWIGDDNVRIRTRTEVI